VPTLEERLLRHLPVGLQTHGLPPVDPHAVDAEGVEQRRHGLERLPQWAGVAVEVDEHAPAPGVDAAFDEVQLALGDGSGGEPLGPVDERGRAVDVPPPAVERAHDLTAPERPAPERQLGGAVAAGVVIALDLLGTGAHDQHRLVADRVLDVVPDGGDLLQPARHLPHAVPEPVALELEEGAVVVALPVDPPGIGDGERDGGGPLVELGHGPTPSSAFRV